MDQFLKKGASYKRLEEEYLKYGVLYIGYDFDSTVSDNYHKTGESHEMVRQLIRDCKEVGFKCICWTANPDLYNNVIGYLNEHRIPCDGVNTDGIPLPWASRKPYYTALLDDRAGLIQVFEDLSLLIHEIKNKRLVYENRSDSREVSSTLSS